MHVVGSSLRCSLTTLQLAALPCMFCMLCVIHQAASVILVTKIISVHSFNEISRTARKSCKILSGRQKEKQQRNVINFPVWSSSALRVATQMAHRSYSWAKIISVS